MKSAPQMSCGDSSPPFSSRHVWGGPAGTGALNGKILLMAPSLQVPTWILQTSQMVLRTSQTMKSCNQARQEHCMALPFSLQHSMHHSAIDGQDPDVKPLSQPSRPWGLRDLDPSTVGGKRWNSAIILVAQDRHVLALGESYTKPVPL